MAGRHRSTKFRFPGEAYNYRDHLSLAFLVEIIRFLLIPPVKEFVNLASKVTNAVVEVFT